MTDSEETSQPVPLVGRIARSIQDVHGAIGFQVWMVPVAVAIPIAWVSKIALEASLIGKIIWGTALFLGSFMMAWGVQTLLRKVLTTNIGSILASKVQGDLSVLGPTLSAGGEISGTVDVVVMWMSKQVNSNPRLQDWLEMDDGIPKKVLRSIGESQGMLPSKLLVIMSQEQAQEIPDVEFHGLSVGSIVEFPESMLAAGALPAVTVVVGPSLDLPDQAAILTTTRGAVKRAINLASDSSKVVADLTGGTVPASIGLYEAATEFSMRVTWCRQKVGRGENPLVTLVSHQVH